MLVVVEMNFVRQFFFKKWRVMAIFKNLSIFFDSEVRLFGVTSVAHMIVEKHAPSKGLA